MSGDGDNGEGFLRRWSRRKGSQPKREAEESAAEAQVALNEAFEEAPVELPPEAPVRGRMITSAPGETESPAEPEEEIDEKDLPDIDSLDADSDFTPFLKKGVSEQLQRRALRKLWLSDPVLANVDGLLDYGEDFTDAAMVVADMKTAYTVGRGMVPPPEEEALDDEDGEVAEEVQAEEAAPSDDEAKEVPAEDGEELSETAARGEEVGEDDGQKAALPGDQVLDSDSRVASVVENAGGIRSPVSKDHK